MYARVSTIAQPTNTTHENRRAPLPRFIGTNDQALTVGVLRHVGSIVLGTLGLGMIVDHWLDCSAQPGGPEPAAPVYEVAPMLSIDKLTGRRMLHTCGQAWG